MVRNPIVALAGRRRLGAVAIVTLAAILVGACGGDDGAAPSQAAPEPAVPAPAAAAVERVTLRTDDGVTIVGEVRRGDAVWLLLGHQNGRDRRAWEPLAQPLHADGFSVLAWDFRGFGESDDGELGDIWVDWLAAIDFAVAEGATTVVAVGASMGGTAVMTAAVREAVTGVVMISAPKEFQGLDAVARAGRVKTPLLLIAGNDDGDAVEDAEEIEAAAAGTAQVEVLDTGLHGNALAASNEFRERILELVRGFVADVR